MSTEKSPLDCMLDWFDHLSQTQRHDVAAIIGPRFPGINLDISVGDIDVQFVSRLRELVTSPLKEWGIVICFRELMEMFVILKRNSLEQWKEARAILEDLALTTGDESHAQRARETEFHGVQWVKSCKRWEEAVRPSISDGYLKSYYSIPPVFPLP